MVDEGPSQQSGVMSANSYSNAIFNSNAYISLFKFRNKITVFMKTMNCLTKYFSNSLLTNSTLYSETDIYSLHEI